MPELQKLPFGFKISTQKSQEEKEQDKVVSFTPPAVNDGSSLVVADGNFSGYYFDLEGTASAKTETDLIMRYRNMASQPEMDGAIDDIINEVVVIEEDKPPVEVVLDDTDLPERTKKSILEEFHNVLDLLDFRTKGHDIVRRWYVDGRIFYHKIAYPSSESKGLKEVRYIDPRKIKKIIEQKIVKQQATNGNDKPSQVIAYSQTNTFYVYNPKGFMASQTVMAGGASQNAVNGIKIDKDAIAYVSSGLYDYKRGMVISHLHKAIKPFNMLRMLEDAVVIYTITRAPERRIFYVDVGNLPKPKAEQYVRELMTKHKNKLIYDPQSGEIKDDRQYMTMLEDYWMPRREGSKGTEITTLQAGQGIMQFDFLEYFRRNLYTSLNIPESRQSGDGGAFNLGRATEVSRDEVKFGKFIQRLRVKFSELFDDVLSTQLFLKNILTKDEWDAVKKKIRYDWLHDNYFSELKDMEIMTGRLQLLTMMQPFIGTYYSQLYAKQTVLRQTDELIERMQEEMDSEPPPMQMGPDGQPFQPQPPDEFPPEGASDIPMGPPNPPKPKAKTKKPGTKKESTEDRSELTALVEELEDKMNE